MKTCHHYLESLSKIDDSKFLFLRYEDMSRDQLSTAKNVYDFIERPMSKKLLKWIDESTKVHGTIGGAYSTIRNSTLTMTAWRHKITFAEVCYYSLLNCVLKISTWNRKIKADKIQNDPKCKEFMEKVGYIQLVNEKSMKSDDISVFHEWRNSPKIFSNNTTTIDGNDETNEVWKYTVTINREKATMVLK